MEMTKTNKIILSAVAILVLVGLYVLLDGRSRGVEEGIGNNEAVATTTGNKVTLPSGVEYEIQKIDSPTSVPKPIPNLDRVLVKSSLAVNVSAQEISSAAPKIKELQDFLKTKPEVVAAWIDLGSYQKSAGDYDGAIISWEYASKLDTKNFVALGNIGNLYGLHMKNVGMSDTYYRRAIARAKGESYLYAQLAEVYQYVGKNITKAKAALNEGLKAIPNDPNLTFLLSELE
ncbi:MAG: tetratricopeptide repeat protein [Patescibacteria group bacterium]